MREQEQQKPEGGTTPTAFVGSVFSPVLTTVLVQLLVTLCLSFVVGFSSNWFWPNLAAVWVGGAIAVAVMVFAVWRGLWRNHSETMPERLLLQLYGAALSKLLLSALLLGLVFKFASALHAGLVLGGFAIASLAGAIALAIRSSVHS